MQTPQSAAEFIEEESRYFPDGTKKSDGINTAGFPETIDQFLERTRKDPHRKNWIGKPNKTRIDFMKKNDEPTELERQVRIELSDMNRKERRAWLKRQSRTAGQVRDRVLTIKVDKAEA